MKQRRFLSLLVAGLATVLMLAGGTFADDGIVFDDYVTQGNDTSDNDTAADPPDGDHVENYSSIYEDGMSETVVEESGSASLSAADYAYEENNDGDDTYVSNDGTTFRIPRVSDNSPRIYDYAELYTAAEEEELTERILKVQAKKDADVILLTSSDVPRDAYYSTETSMRYARQFLLDNHFREDSFIAIIDMSNRVFWAVGYGTYGTQKYLNWGQGVYEKVMHNLSEGDYVSGARTYIHEIDRLDNPLLAAIPTPLSLIISAVLGLLSMLGFNARHKSTQPSRANTPPVRVLGYRSLRHHVQHLGTTVHRRHIERSYDSGGDGGGGGGGGFSGGGFSSGSGGSFSGGGGHF